ncbi:hypothetical protein IMCC12053_995 [Celeribacter marinus]|uniref:Uncharacterized protein n=1 Tax=Celeribacter marinus TaxID=1397108 RepID=A0A0N9ZEX1_9RHOB|nr:hypothetical protein IMCC12053_995 [Celeribacter marinus]
MLCVESRLCPAMITGKPAKFGRKSHVCAACSAWKTVILSDGR